MTPFQAAVDFADQAIPTFPCLADKSPAIKGGFNAASLDHRPEAWPSDALVGVPTGEASGLDVLDVDLAGLGWLADNEHRLPATYRVRTRSGGCHLYFQSTAGLRCSVSRIAPGVDWRGSGGYVIRWDVTGQPVLENGPVLRPPDWLADAAQGSRVRDIAKSASDICGPSSDAVVSLLSSMPNPDDTDRDTYVRIMLAARGCGDSDDIAEAAIQWACRWIGSPGEDAEREKWERDFATRDAPLAGWPNLLAAAARLGVDVSGYRAADVTEFGSVADVPPRLRMRDRFIHPIDCATGPRRGYLVKGILAPGDVAAVIGSPGAGKSQFAPFLAYAVAQGRSVFNLRTKPGRTLYLAGEDMAGMRQRVHALRLRHGDAPNFALAECGNLTDAATVKDLLDAVASYQPALIVLDTVSATFAGLDENDAAGMGAVVALGRRMAATGAAVLLVHHTAKNGDGTPRGHSVLNGTLDMCLLLNGADDNKIVRGKLTKNRNGACDIEIAFRTEAVSLGFDEDGDSITAPLATELAPMPIDRAPKLTPREQRGLDILMDMGGDAPEQDWRDACDDKRLCTSDDAVNRKKVVGTVLRDLIGKGVVSAGNGRLRAMEQRNRPEQTGTRQAYSEFLE